MNRLNTIIALVFLIICSCSNADRGSESNSESLTETRPKGQASVVDEVSDANILQVAISSKDHTTLVAAVEAAQIEHVLVNAGPLTVFAPVNDAFDALPGETVNNLLKPENKQQLTNILTGHAAPGSYNHEALIKSAEKGRKLYMANGNYLEITVEGEDVFVGGAKVVATIQTTNGIINVVDKVILP
ncbi:MAG: fasciclin domain-containing protein [Balneolaceae bacterium]